MGTEDKKLTTRDHFIALTSAATGIVYLRPGNIDDVHEFVDPEDRMRPRCSVYTAHDEYVVLHTAEEIFAMVDEVYEKFEGARLREREKALREIESQHHSLQCTKKDGSN